MSEALAVAKASETWEYTTKYYKVSQGSALSESTAQPSTQSITTDMKIMLKASMKGARSNEGISPVAQDPAF